MRSVNIGMLSEGQRVYIRSEKYTTEILRVLPYGVGVVVMSPCDRFEMTVDSDDVIPVTAPLYLLWQENNLV